MIIKKFARQKLWSKMHHHGPRRVRLPEPADRPSKSIMNLE